MTLRPSAWSSWTTTRSCATGWSRCSVRSTGSRSSAPPPTARKRVHVVTETEPGRGDHGHPDARARRHRGHPVHHRPAARAAGRDAHDERGRRHGAQRHPRRRLGLPAQGLVGHRGAERRPRRRRGRHGLRRGSCRPRGDVLRLGAAGGAGRGAVPGSQRSRADGARPARRREVERRDRARAVRVRQDGAQHRLVDLHQAARGRPRRGDRQGARGGLRARASAPRAARRPRRCGRGCRARG